MNIEIDESKNIVRYIIIPSVNEASYNSYDGLSDGSLSNLFLKLKLEVGSLLSLKAINILNLFQHIAMQKTISKIK